MNRNEALEKILEYIDLEEAALNKNLIDEENIDSQKYKISQYRSLIFCDELRDYIKENLK